MSLLERVRRTPPATGRIVGLLVGVALLLSAEATVARAQEHPAKVKVPHLEAELIAVQTHVKPGQSFEVGVRFTMQEDWHVYWREPGDSGLAPTFRWSVPQGYRVSEPTWIPPKRHAVDDLITMIYEGSVLIPVSVQAPFQIRGDQVTVSVAVEWLVCEDSEGCIPGEATLALTLPVSRSPNPTKASDHFEAFRSVSDRAPQSMPTSWQRSDDRRSVALLGEGPWRSREATFRVFAEDWQQSDRSASPAVARDGETLTMRMPLAADTQGVPVRFRAVLVVAADGVRTAYDIGWDDTPPDPVSQTPADAATPTAVTSATETPATPAAPKAAVEDDLAWAHAYVEFDADGDSGETERSFFAVLLLALVGGLILNIMPCVLPVLSLKILGFIDQAGGDPRRARLHGYAFAAGVIASFLAVAGLLLVLRSQGEDIGWGFQMQEPKVVLALGLLMFLMGLNLLGVFEVGTSLTGVAGKAQTHIKSDGYAGSFSTGILATVIATPCTAPFMGPAIGYALTQSDIAALSVFGAIGLGMALPYVVLTVFPKFLKFVPRPGPWMETFKQAMAFPMFATVVWLAWVFGRQVGADGLVALLAGLLTIALGAWCYGRFGATHRKPVTRWIWGRGLGAALLVTGIMVALPSGDAAPALAPHAPEGWVAYDGGAVRSHQLAGNPVFLDFTADWCLTCKANEAAFLETDAVKDAFRRHHVVAMQVDWTRKDARITRALAKLDRSSVPLYVIAPADITKPVVVLRTAITTQYVVDALAQTLGKPSTP